MGVVAAAGGIRHVNALREVQPEPTGRGRVGKLPEPPAGFSGSCAALISDPPRADLVMGSYRGAPGSVGEQPVRFGPDQEWEGWIDDALGRGRLGALGESLIHGLLDGAAWSEVPARQRLHRLASGEVRLLVVHGLVRLYLVNVEGRELTVGYARAGEVVGLSAVVGPPHPIHAQSVTNAAVGYLRIATVAELATTSAPLGLMIAAELAGRLRGMLDEINAARFGKVRQRLVRQRLACHVLELGEPGAEGSLVVRASQADLATAIGSVRDVVARTLLELRGECLAHHGDEGWVLDDAGRLYGEAALDRLGDREPRQV